MCIASSAAGRAGSLLNSSMCSSTDADYRAVYIGLRDLCPVGPLMMRVCMLRSVTWAWSGIHHNIVCGHRHPLRTAFYDTVILELCPSYMLNSSPLHKDTYPDSVNLPLLRRYWLANNGTMLTVRAVSLTLCSSIAMLVAGLGCPSTSAKILVDLCFVCMNGSPTIPAWDVHAISHASEVI